MSSAPLDRVDGRLKVMGAATYPIDVNPPGLAYAALVQSTVIERANPDIAVDAAERAPGVLAVITHVNTPPLAHAPATRMETDRSAALPPFQSDAVLHYGQHVAMVVAETRKKANAAAALVEVTYERDAPVLSFDDPRASPCSHPWTPDYNRGDVPSALAAADVQVTQTYTTAENTNNPIGLFATVAVWDGDALTVHDTTQILMACATRWRPRSASIQPACACWCRSSVVRSAQGCASGRRSRLLPRGSRGGR